MTKRCVYLGVCVCLCMPQPLFTPQDLGITPDCLGSVQSRSFSRSFLVSLSISVSSVTLLTQPTINIGIVLSSGPQSGMHSPRSWDWTGEITDLRMPRSLGTVDVCSSHIGLLGMPYASPVDSAG